jgi:hypothetical protein
MEDMAGLDSNCLTFLLEALEGIAEPTDALAAQKIALVRLFFYGTPLLARTQRRGLHDRARSRFVAAMC